jgi:hypothetical protein
MGISKSQEKILAAAFDHYFAFVWGADSIYQRIGNCSFYLYFVLKKRKNNGRGNFRNFSILPRQRRRIDH